MIKPKILWQGAITEDELNVELVDSSKSNRAIDPTVEAKLQDKWEQQLVEAKEKGATLYDGTSYRLEEIDFDGKRLSIKVSPMKFRVRSTLKKMPELEELGEMYYSHGLSVGGFVITTDSQYVFATKSNKVFSETKRDIIGGVLEVIEPFSGKGIFEMNKRELREEINVDSEMIKEMKVIGIVLSPSTDIIIITLTKLKLSVSELKVIFEKRADLELEGIEFVSLQELNNYLESLGGYKPVMKKLKKH